jgi:very-short-patch-repair endonuclease
MSKLSRWTVVTSRKLRKNPTDAERLLWRHIRMQQVGNFRFRRQHPIGKYIVDFACTEKRLIVEIDGGHHADRVDYDVGRTRYFEARGYRVLRFWDNEVLKSIDAVKEQIWLTLSSKEPPPPQPSP